MKIRICIEFYISYACDYDNFWTCQYNTVWINQNAIVDGRSRQVSKSRLHSLHTQKKTGLENQYGTWLKYCKAKVLVVLVLEVVLLLFSMSCFDKNSNTLTYMFV